jgi:hypothetical protein
MKGSVSSHSADVNRTTAIILNLMRLTVLKQGQTLSRDYLCSWSAYAETLKDVHKMGCIGSLNMSRIKMF